VAMLGSGGIYVGLEEGKAEGVGQSSLKMETVCFPETLASTDESTRCQNPEEHHISIN
jgi:hypothetical protein